MDSEHAHHVQKELETYLDRHDFHPMFTTLVETLLAKKPSNVILFMVEYLLEKYPIETESIHLKFVKPVDKM